jgi:hypothetical protein
VFLVREAILLRLYHKYFIVQFFKIDLRDIVCKGRNKMNCDAQIESIDLINDKIKLDPLNIKIIRTQQHILNFISGVEWHYLHDLSSCINLNELIYTEHSSGNEGWDQKRIPTILKLSFCIKLTHLELGQINQYTMDNIDLTQCVNLTKLIIQTKNIGTPINISPVINKLNLTKCVNLTHFSYGGGTILKDCKIFLPDLSKCIKLKKFNCNNYDQVINLLDLKLFPDMVTFNNSNLADLNYRLCKLEKQLNINDETHTKEQLKTEERLAKLEEDNRELRKIIDELQPAKSKFM